MSVCNNCWSTPATILQMIIWVAVEYCDQIGITKQINTGFGLCISDFAFRSLHFGLHQLKEEFGYLFHLSKTLDLGIKNIILALWNSMKYQPIWPYLDLQWAFIHFGLVTWTKSQSPKVYRSGHGRWQ